MAFGPVFIRYYGSRTHWMFSLPIVAQRSHHPCPLSCNRAVEVTFSKSRYVNLSFFRSNPIRATNHHNSPKNCDSLETSISFQRDLQFFARFKRFVTSWRNFVQIQNPFCRMRPRRKSSERLQIGSKAILFLVLVLKCDQKPQIRTIHENKTAFASTTNEFWSEQEFLHRF